MAATIAAAVAAATAVNQTTPDQAMIAAMGMKGNAAHLAARSKNGKGWGGKGKGKDKGNLGPKGKGKGGPKGFMGTPPKEAQQCKIRGCDGFHSDVRECPSLLAAADPSYKLGSGRCLAKVYAFGKKWICGSKTHFARHHHAQHEREHPGQGKSGRKSGKGVHAGTYMGTSAGSCDHEQDDVVDDDGWWNWWNSWDEDDSNYDWSSHFDDEWAVSGAWWESEPEANGESDEVTQQHAQGYMRAAAAASPQQVGPGIQDPSVDASATRAREWITSGYAAAPCEQHGRVARCSHMVAGIGEVMTNSSQSVERTWNANQEVEHVSGVSVEAESEDLKEHLSQSVVRKRNANQGVEHVSGASAEAGSDILKQQEANLRKISERRHAIFEGPLVHLVLGLNNYMNIKINRISSKTCNKLTNKSSSGRATSGRAAISSSLSRKAYMSESHKRQLLLRTRWQSRWQRK